MKRWILHLVMTVLFLLHFSFFGWLIWITYFRPLVRASQLAEAYEGFEEIAYIVDRTENMRGHFHNVDESIDIERQNSSFCLKCHGTYPHSKAKDVRSFLNAHSFFMACEVCHVRREDGTRIVYRWVKAGGDEELEALHGPPGNYGGIIVPFREEKGVLKRLDRTLNDKLILRYLKLRDELTADQVAELKLKIHKGISSKPVFCDECHREGGYIDFNTLLYPPERVKVLTSTEVVGMIEKYKEFYLPTMFDPKVIMMERRSKP